MNSNVKNYFGLIFFLSHYAVFDIENNKVGFSPVSNYSFIETDEKINKETRSESIEIINSVESIQN